MLGFQIHELQNQPMHEIVNHSTSEGIVYAWRENPIYQTIQTGEVHHITNEIFWRKDKTSFPVEYFSTPIREQKQIVGAVVIFKDIPPENLETIFDRFNQVDASDSRARSGTGLGLAICRSIVQLRKE
jgi:signal transduction histidine kinase